MRRPLGLLEALFDVLDGANVRLNWISQLNSKVSGRLQVGVNFTQRFDNVPVPGTGNLDTVTTMSLLYSLL